MKLGFIKNINGYDEHAIRLSDFNAAQAGQFLGVVRELIATPHVSIDLASLDFIEPVNCSLTLRTSKEDDGISTNDNVIFHCDLSTGTYRSVADLLEPFSRKESKGYQWLYDLDTPIGFLFSSGKDLPGEE